jgi:hypothetical protein
MRRCSISVLSGVIIGATLLAAAPPARAQAEAQASKDDPVRLFFNAGSGLPEVLHASVGKFFGSRLSLAGRINLTLFNPMLGVEALYSVGDTRGPRPPRHALLLGGSAMLNPTELKLSGHGETIAATFGPTVGYAYLADGRIYFRTLLAALIYHQGGDDPHFEVGPSLSLGLGLAF